MTKSLNIVVLVDASTIPADDLDFEQPEDKKTTEYHVAEALRLLGHKVSAIGVFNDLPGLINQLQNIKPDLVFNLTEQFYGERLWDKNITAVLEMLELPFTGAGMMGLMLCRDKRLSKQLLGLHRIRVPNFISVPINKKPKISKSIHYPLVVKPALGDGSEGIANASLVSNEEALRQRCEFIHERWQQDAIAEEYIDGREFYVTVVGNKRLTVFPPRECAFNPDNDGGPNLATYRVKWNDKYREQWGIEFGFADLDEPTFKRIAQNCKRVFKFMHLQDYGRIDLRMTPEGRIYILEVNPNPDLGFGEEVAESAERAGISYEELIKKIIRLALKRNNT